MIVLAYILLILGLALGVIGDVKFLVIAYRHGVGWFLACLLVPFVGWVFFLLFTRETWRPMVLSWAGFLIAGTGYAAGHFRFLS